MKKLHCSSGLAVLLALFAVSLSAVTHAQGNNPGIVPPEANYAGRSAGEWTAAWWQWALGIPEAQNPVEDTTGEFCAVGQSGPVWFMGSSFTNCIARQCIRDADKSLFLPVHPV